MGENNSRLILKPHPVFESRNVYKIPKRNFNYIKQTNKQKNHWEIVTKLSQYERICKITQEHFFFKRQEKKKKTDIDMFLEMKLTKSPSTEDGVKTSQMLWGVQLQNVIKPWVAPLKKRY